MTLISKQCSRPTERTVLSCDYAIIIQTPANIKLDKSVVVLAGAALISYLYNGGEIIMERYAV